MLSNSKKAEKMVANYQSTYSATYNEFPSFPIKAPIYEQKTKTIVRRKPIKKDICTLSEWRNEVPMTLFYKPKEIVRTNPHHVTQPFTKSADTGLEEVRRTRPRLTIAPAMALDDVEDATTRNILLNDMYTSSTIKAFRETLRDARPRVQAPLPPLPGPANPVNIPKPRPLYVPPEWRMDSAAWDRRQVRAHCEATKEFWLRRPEPSCTPCKQSAAIRAHRRANIL